MTEKSLLEEVVNEFSAEFYNILNFSKDIKLRSSSDGISPYPFQSLRFYEAIKNGTKRMLLWDSTSAGKTFTASMIKALEDEERIKRGEKQSTFLVLSPESGIYTAWTEEEINGYCDALKLPRQKIYPITDLESARNIPSDATIVIANYHKFGYKKPKIVDKKPDFTDNKYFNRILELLPKFDGIVFDEAHNLSNPLAFRTLAIEEIIKRTLDKRVLLLDATPARNVIEDFGPILHFLKPNVFPLAEYNYSANPDAIRNLIAAGQIYTLRREDVQQLFNLGELKICPPIYKEMPNDFADAYFDLWANESADFSIKVPGLRKISLNSKLVRSERSREDSLADIVQGILKENPEEQILTFSYLISGVSDKILKNLFPIFSNKITRIDGKSARNIFTRLERARKFREGEYQASVNGIDATGEAFPMQTYDRDCSILLLQPFITPGHENQAIGRVFRKLQTGRVSVYPMLAVSKRLRERMLEFKEKWEKDNDKEFPVGWEPRSIDEDEYIIGQVKSTIFIEKIPKAIRLNDIESIIASTNLVSNPGKAQKEAEKHGFIVYKSLPPRSSRKNEENVFVEGITAASWLYGIGSNILKLLRISDDTLRKIGFNDEMIYNINLVKQSQGRLRKGYKSDQFYVSPSANTLNLMKNIAETLENKLGKRFKVIGDLGCGTACASKIFNRPMINLDIDYEMLSSGRESIDKRTRLKKNSYILGDLADLPFKNNSFDLLLASYSFMYLSQQFIDGNFERQVEDALIQANNCLKPGGFFIFSYPNRASFRRNALSQEKFDLLNKTAAQYGLNVLLSDVFVGKSRNEQGRKVKTLSGVFASLLQKNRHHDSGYISEEPSLIIFKNDKTSVIKPHGGLRALHYKESKSLKMKSGMSEEYIGEKIGNLDDYLDNLELNRLQ